MPIWGNTDVVGQNGGGKVNQSRPTHYDIGMNLRHWRPTGGGGQEYALVPLLPP